MLCGETSRCTTPSGWPSSSVSSCAAWRPGARVGDDARGEARLHRRHLPGAAQDVDERLAVDPLHREVEDLALLAELVDLADVRVMNDRRDARLVEEHPLELGLLGEVREDRLDRDGLREAALAVLARRPHARHAALRDGDEQLVATEARPRLKLVGGNAATSSTMSSGASFPPWSSCYTPARRISRVTARFCTSLHVFFSVRVDRTACSSHIEHEVVGARGPRPPRSRRRTARAARSGEIAGSRARRGPGAGRRARDPGRFDGPSREVGRRGQRARDRPRSHACTASDHAPRASSFSTCRTAARSASGQSGEKENPARGASETGIGSRRGGRLRRVGRPRRGGCRGRRAARRGGHRRGDARGIGDSASSRTASSSPRSSASSATMPVLSPCGICALYASTTRRVIFSRLSKTPTPRVATVAGGRRGERVEAPIELLGRDDVLEVALVPLERVRRSARGCARARRGCALRSSSDSWFASVRAVLRVGDEDDAVGAGEHELARRA